MSDDGFVEDVEEEEEDEEYTLAQELAQLVRSPPCLIGHPLWPG